MWIPLSDLVEATKKKPTSITLRTKEPRDPEKSIRDRKPEPPKPANRPDAVQKKLASQDKRKKTLAKKRKAAMAQAMADNKADRQARAAQTRDRAKEKAGPPTPPGLASIPAQIAHCMMAVHVKRGKSKRAAWNICRWSMTKHGYLKGPYKIGAKLPNATRPTAKGTRRNFQHGMEKGPLNGGVKGNGKSKFKKFTKMFKDLEPKLLPKELSKGVQ